MLKRDKFSGITKIKYSVLPFQLLGHHLFNWTFWLFDIINANKWLWLWYSDTCLLPHWNPWEDHSFQLVVLLFVCSLSHLAVMLSGNLVVVVVVGEGGYVRLFDLLSVTWNCIFVLFWYSFYLCTFLFSVATSSVIHFLFLFASHSLLLPPAIPFQARPELNLFKGNWGNQLYEKLKWLLSFLLEWNSVPFWKT